MLAVRVIPLVWERTTVFASSGWKALTPWGEYQVFDGFRGGMLCLYHPNPSQEKSWHDSEALAFATAQADHDARIMAALEPAPDPRDVVIAQLVEAGTRLSHKHQPSENDNMLARQMKMVALAKWNAALAAAKAVMP